MALRAFEVRWAETVGRALAPRGILGGVTDAIPLGAKFRAEHAGSPWYVALLLRASLWLTWLAPLWLERRFRTFGGLADAEREAILERLLKLDSYNVRLAAMFLKITACTLILGDLRVLKHLNAYGLDGKTS